MTSNIRYIQGWIDACCIQIEKQQAQWAQACSSATCKSETAAVRGSEHTSFPRAAREVEGSRSALLR